MKWTLTVCRVFVSCCGLKSQGWLAQEAASETSTLQKVRPESSSGAEIMHILRDGGRENDHRRGTKGTPQFFLMTGRQTERIIAPPSKTHAKGRFRQ